MIVPGETFFVRTTGKLLVKHSGTRKHKMMMSETFY